MQGSSYTRQNHYKNSWCYLLIATLRNHTISTFLSGKLSKVVTNTKQYQTLENMSEDNRTCNARHQSLRRWDKKSARWPCSGQPSVVDIRTKNELSGDTRHMRGTGHRPRRIDNAAKIGRDDIRPQCNMTTQRYSHIVSPFRKVGKPKTMHQLMSNFRLS